MSEEMRLPGGVATGVGSMPGDDVAEAMRIITGELSGFLHLPEIPGRSEAASMTGRATAILVDLAVDLQPAGWRLTDAPGLDQRRARSLLGQDLDALEEHTQGYAGPLKTQVCGPWTLAATVERPRGDRVLADHGARRELAQSVSAGIADHVAEVRRRVPTAAPIVVQVDEPALPAVLAGAVPTASGFGKHRIVDEPAAVEALRWYTDAITESGAIPVLHCCADTVPLGIVQQAGFAALSCDVRAIASQTYDDFAALIDGGVQLWLGVVPTLEPAQPLGDAELTENLLRLLEALGADPEDSDSRFVITPACGLAGATPGWARQALRLASTVARNVSGRTGKMGT